MVGAIDEITDTSYAVLNRMGLYKQKPVLNMELFQSNPEAIGSRGTIAGEGAGFFLLANEPSATDYAKLDGLSVFYKPGSKKEIEEHILSFLSTHSITPNDIDLVITGKNGDPRPDEIFDLVKKNIFNKNDSVNYKHLCGEYPTSTAFAVWVAANIIRSGSVPPALEYTGSKEKKIRRVLIYNHYLDIHHSLILVSSC